MTHFLLQIIILIPMARTGLTPWIALISEHPNVFNREHRRNLPVM